MDPHLFNRAQMPWILLHPLLDLGQCIYILTRLMETHCQSIEHRCLEYHHTIYIGPFQSIQHRGLAYIALHCRYICLLTSSGQEWQFHIATDMSGQLSMAISHCY